MARQLILLVEDEVDAAQILSFLLRAEEYEVVHATHGDQALVLARHRRPDVILLDLELPVMDGRQVLAAVRSDDELSAIPVVIVSGSDGVPPEGADAYVRKPLHKEQLLAVLREVYRFVPPAA